MQSQSKRSRSTGRTWLAIAMASAISLVLSGQASASNGVYTVGAGPVNSTMGGAATGYALEPLGTLMWNPAGSVFLDQTQLAISLEAVYHRPRVETLTRFLPDGIGGFTRTDMSGNSNQPADLAVNFALTMHPDNWDTALHVGVLTSATWDVSYDMGQVSYESSGTQVPATIDSQFRVWRMPIGMSFLVDKDTSIGFSLLPTVAQLRMNPFYFTAPTMATDGWLKYPSQNDMATSVGVAAQVGIMTRPTEGVVLGLQITSPTWIKQFEADVRDANGGTTTAKYDLDLPTVVSIGGGIDLIEDTLFVADLRWVNYRNTDGFRQFGYDANGALKGLGWSNSLSAGLGIQQKFTSWLKGRIGYSYTGQIIEGDHLYYSTAIPAIVKHSIGAGFTFVLQDTQQSVIEAHVGYLWGVGKREEAGLTYYTPPNLTVREEEHTLGVGISFKF